MKRFICLVLLCLLLALPVQAMAQTEPSLKLTVTQDDMIYVTVALEGSVEGVSLGVTAEIDHLLLESVPDASQWKVQGLLSDFNNKGQGVWTTDKPTALEGEVVVLAFRARTAEAFETSVTCTLIVKNGAQEGGRYTAKTTVKVTKDAPPATEATQPSVTPQPTVATVPAPTTVQTQPQTPTTVPAATQESVPVRVEEVVTTEDYAESTSPTATRDDASRPNSSWLIWVLVAIGAVAVAVGGSVMRRRDQR